MTYQSILFKVISLFVIVYLYDQTIDVLWPSPISPIAFPPPAPQSFHTDPLILHDWLSQGLQRLDFLPAPESFTLDSQGRLYMGLKNGAIVRTRSPVLSSDPAAYERLCVTGSPPSHLDCMDERHEHRCGRPLGMHFDRHGHLIVADALGLLSVNVTTGAVRHLATHDGAGRPLTFLNALAIHPVDDTVFFTESSVKFPRNQVLHEVLEGGAHGRLCAYFPHNGTVQCLLEGLPFPNGLAFADQHSTLLVTSSTRCSLLKYHLASRSVLWQREGYPGILDNIVPRANGRTYWIGCTNLPSKLLRGLAMWPRVRKELARYIPAAWFLHFQVPYGLVLEVDAEGELLKVLTDEQGTISFISEAMEFDGHLILGSFHNLFLGYLPINDHHL